MTTYVRDHRGDGTTVVVDSSDNTAFEIPTDDWPAIAALPNEQQRAALEDLKLRMAQLRNQEEP